MRSWEVSLSVDGAEILNISDEGIGGHDDILEHKGIIVEASESLANFIRINNFEEFESDF